MLSRAQRAKNLKLNYLKTRNLTTEVFNQVIDLIVGDTSSSSSAGDAGDPGTITAEFIRNLLETLLADERLNATAIRDIQDSQIAVDEELVDTGPGNPLITTAEDLFIYILDRLINIQEQLDAVIINGEYFFVEATSVSVQHNAGRRVGTTITLDTGEEILTTVNHVSLNNLIVSFARPKTGTILVQ